MEFEFRILLHLLEDETESREKCRNATILLEKSIANENWLQKVLAIEFIIVKWMNLKQFKRIKEHFFEDVNLMY
jgi:hypothetical protein